MLISLTQEHLKVAAAVCGVMGSMLLAFRVSGIINALGMVAILHEKNIEQLIKNPQVIVHFAESTKAVARAQRTRLLYTGFALFILSGLLQLASLLI